MLPRRLLALLPVAALACSGASRGSFLVYEDGGAEGGDDGGTTAITQGQDAGGSGSCSAVSCFFGCCQGGTCVTPGTDMACGALGAACRDCTSLGQRCQIGACSGPRRGGLDAGPG